MNTKYGYIVWIDLVTNAWLIPRSIYGVEKSCTGKEETDCAEIQAVYYLMGVLFII